MKFRRSARLANLEHRKTEVEFRALGLSFAMQSSGEIQIAGALGAEFAPETVIAGATTALVSAPLGTASVHGLIKTLFPISQASSGRLGPTYGRVASPAFPTGSAERGRRRPVRPSMGIERDSLSRER